VLDVQARLQALGYPVTPAERGRFDRETTSAVKAFQVRRGLVPDGIVGPLTWRELVEAGLRLGNRMLYLRHPPLRGDDVRDLQIRLNALGFDAGKEDGIFGVETQTALRQFQRGSGLPTDGIVARDTLEALSRLSRRILPGSKAALRERIARESGGVERRTIYLDPGHGGRDVGIVTSPGVPESYVVYRVAEAAHLHLTGLGAEPVYSRLVHQGPDVDRRTGAANASRSDAAVSFHVGCRPDPGPSLAYWSVEGTHSSAGRDLAEALSERLRPLVGRAPSVLGRNLPFLRQTRMPAVVVDLASPGSDSLWVEDPYLTGLGEAVAAGVRDYFSLTA